MHKNSIKNQVHDNFVAIISLVIAMIALSYNTWRNERTEANRNIRPAAFEILNQLGQLQLVVNNTRYVSGSPDSMNPLLGWGRVSYISDLSQLLPAPIPAEINKLVVVWGDNWEKIRKNGASADKITQTIDSSRSMILALLKELK